MFKNVLELLEEIDEFDDGERFPKEILIEGQRFKKDNYEDGSVGYLYNDCENPCIDIFTYFLEAEGLTIREILDLDVKAIKESKLDNIIDKLQETTDELQDKIKELFGALDNSSEDNLTVFDLITKINDKNIDDLPKQIKVETYTGNYDFCIIYEGDSANYYLISEDGDVEDKREYRLLEYLGDGYNLSYILKCPIHIIKN